MEGGVILVFFAKTVEQHREYSYENLTNNPLVLVQVVPTMQHSLTGHAYPEPSLIIL